MNGRNVFHLRQFHKILSVKTLTIILFTSEDGINFSAISKEPQITTQGAEEGEFIFDKEGNIWSTVRLEGSGSYLCFASKDSIDKWTKKFSKKKYDSALLFSKGDDIY